MPPKKHTKNHTHFNLKTYRSVSHHYIAPRPSISSNPTAHIYTLKQKLDPRQNLSTNHSSSPSLSPPYIYLPHFTHHSQQTSYKLQLLTFHPLNYTHKFVSLFSFLYSSMATTVAKPKAPKVPKEKKAAVAKKPRAHPPYADVYTQSILNYV